MSFLSSTTNLSLYAIPAAWVLSIAPHFYAASLFEGLPSSSWDNTNPRGQLSKLANLEKPTPLEKKIVRAEAAQQNGFENVGLFAAAVGAANFAKVDVQWLNALAVGYLASRVVYNLLYINTTDQKVSWSRVR